MSSAPVGVAPALTVDPAVRGAARHRIITAAANGDDGAGLDPDQAHLVRVIEYDVPDRDGNGTGELVLLALTAGPRSLPPSWPTSPATQPRTAPPRRQTRPPQQLPRRDSQRACQPPSDSTSRELPDNSTSSYVALSQDVVSMSRPSLFHATGFCFPEGMGHCPVSYCALHALQVHCRPTQTHGLYPWGPTSDPTEKQNPSPEWGRSNCDRGLEFRPAST